MALEMVVCIKSVMLEAPVGKARRNAATCVLNPFDLPALETALQLKERYGGRTTALSMGPPETAFALRECLAMGIDRAVLLSDPALAGSDTLATAAALAAGLGKLAPWDLAFFGIRSSDSDTGQVGPQTAVRMDLPLITGMQSLTLDGSEVRVDRRMDGFCEIYTTALPAVLTVLPTACAARDLSLQGIEQAFAQGIVETWSLMDLDLNAARVGLKGSPTEVLSMQRIRKDRQCEFLNGTAEAQVEALIDRLIEMGRLG